MNIAAVAQKTGVPPDTLRKWEQRYGVLRPDLTQGGQRRYSDQDVARVEWLRARLEEGYRIGEAAALLGAIPITTGGSTDECTRRSPPPSSAATSRRSSASSRRRSRCNSLEDALADVLAPALAGVGDRWEAGEVSVAQEHLVTGIAAHTPRTAARRPPWRRSAAKQRSPGSSPRRMTSGRPTLARACCAPTGGRWPTSAPTRPFGDARRARARSRRALDRPSAPRCRISVETLSQEPRCRTLPGGTLAIVVGGRAVRHGTLDGGGADGPAHFDRLVRRTAGARTVTSWSRSAAAQPQRRRWGGRRRCSEVAPPSTLPNHDYSDVAMLGKFVTRAHGGGRSPGLAIHAGNGAGFGVAVQVLRSRTGADPRRLALTLALAEHLITSYPLSFSRRPPSIPRVASAASRRS